eukprot:SAG25_NODE_2286_length_1753_cov_1.524788_1_plen_97_part_10
MKYAYVVSCQIYGNWNDKSSAADKALKAGIDELMKRFPHVRIAYVKEEKDPYATKKGAKKYYSYLVRWCQETEGVVTCFRIEQPCSEGGKGNWGPKW